MEISRKTHRTKKQGKPVSLPTEKNYIYQPNRVTNAVYSYSLVQERLLNAVMYYLQDAISINLKGEDYRQLKLFKDAETSDNIRISIPLREITIPQHYEYVKKAVRQLAGIVVNIPYTDKKTNKDWEHVTGLLKANIPKTGDRSSEIEIFIDKLVAKKLIETEQNQLGQPINYTRFIYEIAQSAKNKYTSKIYKLLCSWRKKGGFSIPLDEFRLWIGVMRLDENGEKIEDKYKYFNDLKKHVLSPVQDELFEKADCWFNCNSEDFVTKQGNTVTHLNFKVITPELIEEEGKRKDYAIHLLRTHFKFQDKHIDLIRPIFENANMPDILFKITQLREYYLDNATKIADITGYTIKALLNEFGNPSIL